MAAHRHRATLEWILPLPEAFLSAFQKVRSQTPVPISIIRERLESFCRPRCLKEARVHQNQTAHDEGDGSASPLHLLYQETERRPESLPDRRRNPQPASRASEALLPLR